MEGGENGLGPVLSTSSWTEWESIPMDQGNVSGDPFEDRPPRNENHEDPQTVSDFKWSSAFDAESFVDDATEDWANFSSIPEQQNIVSQKDFPSPTISEELARSVFKTCFEFPSESNQGTLLPDRPSIDSTPPPLSYEKNFLKTLYKSSQTFSSSSWSHLLIKDQFLLALMSHQEDTIEQDSQEFDGLDLVECVNFDWSNSDDEGSDKDESGVSFSPDLMLGLLRPNTGIDSPIHLEFDHDKAMLGLSMLPEVDLTMMRDDMASKVNKQSELLVTLLQQRDVLCRETDIKNKFIVALLAVQNQKHALLNNISLASSVNTTGNGAIGGNMFEKRVPSDDKLKLKPPEERPRSRSRSRSFSQSLSKSITQSFAWAKSKKLSSDEKPNDMFLHVVIPYRTCTNGCYSISVLKQWIKLLKAMSDKNPNLPHLISLYLQSEVFNYE